MGTVAMNSPAMRGSPPSVERFNRLQKVVQDIGGAHHDMEYMSKQRKDTMDMRFTNLESAVRKLEARLEDEAHDRVNAEKRLRQDVEERIAGVESRLETEFSKLRHETAQNVEVLKEQVATA